MEGISEEVSSDSFCENILSFLLVVLNVLEFARHSIWYFYDSLYSERKMMDLSGQGTYEEHGHGKSLVWLQRTATKRNSLGWISESSWTSASSTSALFQRCRSHFRISALFRRCRSHFWIRKSAVNIPFRASAPGILCLPSPCFLFRFRVIWLCPI